MRRDDPDPHGLPATTEGVDAGALLPAVVHTVADAIITAGDDGRISMWAGGAEAIFGWSADEALGRPLRILMPERLVEAHEAGHARVVAGGAPRLAGAGVVDVVGLRRDGTEFPAELTLTTGEHDGRRFFAAVIRDVTSRQVAEDARREALEELAQANEELRRFASVASHDLNEPLRIVDGYLQLLSRRYGPQLDDTGREFIGHAVSAVGRMQRLIDDLLRYARAGGEGLDPTDVDLAATCRDVLADLTALLEEKGAAVRIGALPTVRGDARLLRQVLQNLIGNAVKYGPVEGPAIVEVTAETHEDRWEIAVTDNGLGVDPAAATTIFEMFGRGSGPARERSGSGIGLAIVKRAVEAHGGVVAVGPRPDGGAGSRFSFTLPRHGATA